MWMAAVTMSSPTAKAKARVDPRGIAISSLEADHGVVGGVMPEYRSPCYDKTKRNKGAVNH
jgi:hypothetical protein